MSSSRSARAPDSGHGFPWLGQLGVAVATSGNKYRRYTAEDVERLRRMLRLTGEGVPPAVAARLELEPAATTGSATERDGGGTGTFAVGCAA